MPQESWVERLERAERRDAAALSVTATRNSQQDAAARANAIARKTGLSADVIERNLREIEEREANRRRVEAARNAQPYTQTWLANPRNAAAAGDDLPALDRITRTVQRRAQRRSEDNAQDDGFFDRLGSVLSGGMDSINEGLWRVGGALQEWSANNPLPWTSEENVEEAREQSATLRQRAKLLASTAPVAGRVSFDDVLENPSVSNIASFAVTEGIGSLPGMIAAGIAPVAFVTSQAGNIGQQRAMNNGREDASLLDIVAASPAAVTSLALERFGISKILRPVGSRAITRVGTAGLIEAGTEFAQGLLEYEGATYGTEAGFDLAEGLKQAAGGALAGGFVGSSLRTTVEVGRPIRRAVRNYAEARRTRAASVLVDQLESDVSQLKLREADPEAVRDYVGGAADGSPIENVYIPGTAIRELMQDGYRDDPFWGQHSAQIDEAVAMEGEVVLPIGEVAAHLFGTPEWQLLKPNARYTAGGKSEAEIAADMEANADEDVLARLTEISDAANAESEPAAQVYAEFKQAFEDAGYTPQAADRYAQTWAARRETEGNALGMDAMAYHRANPIEIRRVDADGNPVAGVAGRSFAQQRIEELAGANDNQDAYNPAQSLRTMMNDPRPTTALYEQGDFLSFGGESGEVVAADDQSVTLALPSGQITVERADADLTVAPISDWRVGESNGRELGQRGLPSERNWTPLEAAPRVAGEQFGPVAEVARAAEAYAEQAGIRFGRQAEYVEVDEEFAARVANAYAEMDHAPQDPAVAEAYAAMIEQTRAQYDALVAAGFVFEFGDPDSDYFASGFNALRDLRDNKRMLVFPTTAGFGSDATFDPAENPLNADTGLTWPDHTGAEQPVLANDLFRAVHDAFGHGIEGAGFRARGEENAWQAHARLFTGPALAAMTSETRGQNSWVNYGPHGEANRNASAVDTIYADQKTGLLPAWAWTERRAPSMPDPATIGFEVAPDPNDAFLSERWNALRDDAKARVSAKVAEPVVEAIGKALGAPAHYREQLGGYLGEINVSFAAEVDADPVTAAKAIGYALRQDSVVVDADAPFEGSTPTGVISLDAATEADAKRIGEALWSVNEQHDGAIIGFSWSKETGELVILNTGSISTDELATAIAELELTDAVRVGERHVAFIGKEDYGFQDREETAENEGDVRAARAEADQRLAEALRDEEGPQGQEGGSLYQVAPQGDAFREWAGTDAPVIEPEDINDTDFNGPGPFVMRAFHGTTHEFEAFDASVRGTKEGQFGAVNYFTSSKADADSNYAGEGPDLTNRIETRAERLANEWIDEERDGRDDWSYDDPEVRAAARAELAGENPQTLEVFIRTEKPFVVGSDDSPWIEFTDFEALERQAIERVADDSGVTVEEIEAARDDYEEQIDEVRWEIEGETPNALYEAVEAVASRYDLDAQKIYGDLADTVAVDGTQHNRLEEILRQTESLSLAEDPEYGDLIGYHVLGEIIAELGFDSIVMKNAHVRFANMGIEPGTAHVHVFDQHNTNIKSVENTGTFDRNDPRILYQRRIFYSALERAVEGVKTNRAPAQQWIGTLKKTAGVKQEELDWSGVLDWLELQTETVDKEVLLEVVRAGGLVVDEIELRPVSEDDLDPAHIAEMISDRDSEFYDYWEGGPYYYETFEDDDGETVWTFEGEEYNSEEDAQEAVDEANNAAEAEAYDAWEDGMRDEVVADLMERDSGMGAQYQGYSLSQQGDPSYRELLITLPPGQKGNPKETVSGTHYDEYENEGIVAHTRFFDAKGPNGERILFLDEVQSDWHQQGRDEGYAREPSQKEVDAARDAFEQARFELGKARGALEARVEGPVPDGASLNAELMAEPDVRELWDAYKSAGRAYDDAQETLNAVERGVEVEKIEAARAKQREAIDAREAALANMLPDFAALRDLLRPLMETALEEVRAEAERDYEGREGQIENFVQVKRNELYAQYVEGEQIAASDFNPLTYAAQALSRRNDGLPTEVQSALDRTADLREEFDRVSTEALLRNRELGNALNGGSIPDAPFKDSWPALVMKRVTVWAAEGGYDQVAWVKQGENNGGMNDNVDWFYGRNLPNMVNKFLKPHKVKVKPLRVEGRKAAEGASPRLTEIDARMAELNEASAGVVRAIGGIPAIKEKWERSRAILQDKIEGLEKEQADRRKEVERAEAEGDSHTVFGNVSFVKQRIEEEQAHLEGEQQKLDRTADWDALVPMIEEYRALTAERSEIERTAPTNLGFDITPELREAAKEGFALFQQKDAPRGSVSGGIIAGQDGPTLMRIFEGSDLSTPLHEGSHIWLEERFRNAKLPQAPQWMKDDVETLKKWFADHGHPVARDGTIPTEAHEMFARAGERYFMEGKAPIPALQQAFNSFRGWLLRIYQVVANLNTPINDDIRRVFDRMLATQQAIDEAADTQGIEARFKDAEQAGMTKAEFAAYRQTADEARSEAFDSLLYRTMSSIRKERTKQWQDRHASVKDKVAEEVNAMPVFRALHLLRTGRFLDDPEREPVKTSIDRQWIVDRMGEDALKLMPHGTYRIEGGEHPDDVAVLAGYTSGEEMIEALMGVQAETVALRDAGDTRSVKDKLVADRAQAIMEERYGNPLDDGSIEEEAIAAIHNDKEGELIAAESRTLARRTKTKPTAYNIARRWAANKIATGRVVDVASKAALQRYARNQAKAAKAFEAALLAQDIDEAFRQSEIRLLNHALIAEAKKAADRVEVIVPRLAKVAKQRQRKSIDQEYWERAQDLLAKFEFRQKSQVLLDEREGFEAWAKEQNAKGIDVRVPPRLGDNGVNYTRMSVQELIGLDESVEQLLHLGRKKKEWLDAKDKREFNEVVNEALATIEETSQRGQSDRMNPNLWDNAKGFVRSADASLTKMEQVFLWLDNNKPNGVFGRLFDRIAGAQQRERDMIDEKMRQVRQHLKELPKDTLKRWDDTIRTELLNEDGKPWAFKRQELVSMALNVGNEGNLAKLAGGYRWNPDVVMQVLERELTAEEWQFVQKTWDMVNSLWPQIEAMEKRVNGIAPPKVEARAFTVQTDGGPLELRGGYFPVVYDPIKSYEARKQAALDESGLFPPSFQRATTNAGSTNERTDLQDRQIFLSMSVLTRHLGEVIHDITHREVLMDADRLLSDRRIAGAVSDALGPEYHEQFSKWLQHIANEWATDRRSAAWMEAIGKRLRTHTTIMAMGLRVTSILAQVAGYSGSMEMIGARWLGSGFKAFSTHPVENTRFAMENSKEIAQRMETMDRDINSNIEQLQGKIGTLANVRRFAFHGIGYMDRAVVVPTWLGAYNQALAGKTKGADGPLSHDDAVLWADKVVRMSQGAGGAKDLNEIQRGREFMKLTTMFYSYAATFYARQRALARDSKRAVTEKEWAEFPGLLARAWWLLIVSPIMGGLPSALLSGYGPDDDDDDESGWLEWAGWAITANVFYGIPLVRDVTSSAISGFDYNFTPATRLIETALRAGGDLIALADGDEESEPGDRAVKTAVETVGYTARLPLAQGANAAQFLTDWATGEADPDGVGEWLTGLQRGKIEE